MILQDKSLEKLRLLINEETEYRSGRKLVSFFNDLGFNDSYGKGFPSRWVYTDEKLTQINGTPELDKCIKKLFAPVNFIGRFTKLDNFLKEFNQSKSSPKDIEGKVKQFQDWTLSNYIDVAYDVGLLMKDVRKFSHSLRDFRNYIHPYAQVSSGFNPDKHTATICWQVLKAAIYQLTENKI